MKRYSIYSIRAVIRTVTNVVVFFVLFLFFLFFTSTELPVDPEEVAVYANVKKGAIGTVLAINPFLHLVA